MSVGISVGVVGSEVVSVSVQVVAFSRGGTVDGTFSLFFLLRFLFFLAAAAAAMTAGVSESDEVSVEEDSTVGVTVFLYLTVEEDVEAVAWSVKDGGAATVE